MRTLSLLVTFWLGVHSALAEPREQAMHPEARAHFNRAAALYQNRQYSQAIQALKAGYAIDPRPEFLYSWAQAARLSGDCASAMPLYDRFLATGPAPSGQEQARANRALCEQVQSPPTPELEVGDGVKPDQPAVMPATNSQLAPTSTASKNVEQVTAEAPVLRVREPFYKDVIGDILVGSGIVGLAVGIPFFLSAGSQEDEARMATVHENYRAQIEDAQSKRTIGIVAIVAGTTLITTGVLRFILRRNADDVPAPSAWLGTHEAGVRLGGRF